MPFRGRSGIYGKELENGYGCHGDYRHSRGAAGDGGDPAFSKERSIWPSWPPAPTPTPSPRPSPGRLEATNTGDAILVQGTAAGDATTQCARCLEDVTYGLEGDIEGYFLIGGEEEAETPEDMEGDEFDFLPTTARSIWCRSSWRPCCSRCRLCPCATTTATGLCPQCGAKPERGALRLLPRRGRRGGEPVRGPQELRLRRQVEDPVHNGFSTKGGAAETLRRPSGYECERSSKVVPYGSDAWKRGGMR